MAADSQEKSMDTTHDAATDPASAEADEEVDGALLRVHVRRSSAASRSRTEDDLDVTAPFFYFVKLIKSGHRPIFQTVPTLPSPSKNPKNYRTN